MSPIERTIQVRFEQKVYFTRHLFDVSNPLLKQVLIDGRTDQISNALVVLDESLHTAQPALRRQVEAYFNHFAGCLKLACPPIILEGGERVKNSYFHVSEIQSYIDRYHIDRHSYLLAVGGGALLDVVGLAAATAHQLRGEKSRPASAGFDRADLGVRAGGPRDCAGG